MTGPMTFVSGLGIDLMATSRFRTKFISATQIHTLVLALSIMGTMIGSTAVSCQERYETAIVPQFGHSSVITSVSYSGDGRLLLTAGYDATARLWDVEAGILLREFVAHIEPILAAALSQDGRLIVTGATDLSAKVWDTATGKLVRSFPHPKPYGTVQAVAISTDKTRIYTGTLDGVIREFDLASGALVRSTNAHGTVKALAISRNGRWLLSGGSDKTAILWDALKGKRVREFARHSDEVHFAALSASGDVAATGSKDRFVKVWNANTGRLLRTLSGPLGLPVPIKDDNKRWRQKLSMAISPDGRDLRQGFRTRDYLRD